MKWANTLKKSSKKNSWKPNAASHNSTSWYTDTDGFLEHSPSRESLYYRGPTLQKIILDFWSPISYIYTYTNVDTHTYRKCHRNDETMVVEEGIAASGVGLGKTSGS